MTTTTEAFVQIGLAAEEFTQAMTQLRVALDGLASASMQYGTRADAYTDPEIVRSSADEKPRRRRVINLSGQW